MNFSSGRGGPHPAVPELFHTLISLSDEWLRSSALGHLSVTWKKEDCGVFVAVVQSLSHVQLFATPWTAACQASLSSIISHSLLKSMSIVSVMPSNHIFCCPLFFLPSIFPSIRVCSNESALPIRCQSIGASESVLQMDIQGRFPLGLCGLILLSKGSCPRDPQGSSPALQLENINFLMLNLH